jgi:hypothetical protein
VSSVGLPGVDLPGAAGFGGADFAGADGEVPARAAGAFVDFGGVFRAAGVLSEPTASAGPGVGLLLGRLAAFRGGGDFSPD